MPHDYRGLDANLRALLDLRRLYHEGDPSSGRRLSELLPLFRWSQATDKLDKIYSLLGLVSDADQDIVAIKYKIPLRKCYTPLMVAMLKQSGDLGLLMHCSSPSFVKNRTCRPSWVVDWSYDASHVPASRWGLREANTTHSKLAMTSALYPRYHASDDSSCLPLKLRHGSILTLVGMIVAQVVEIGPAMALHHQPLQPINHKGMFAPIPPLPWNVYVAREWGPLLWKFFTSFQLADIIMFPLNCHRKGAALDILRLSSQIAQPSKTQSRHGEDYLRFFFLTLMRGVEDYQYLQLRILDGFVSDAPQQLANEFRAFQKSLLWNIPHRLAEYAFRTTRLHSIYISVLGLSYENHRGAMPVLGTFLALLSVLITWLGIYLPLIIHVMPIVHVLPPLGFYLSTSHLRNPAKAKLLDMVPKSMMDSRVVRTGNGLVALVPHTTQIGDRIALLKGGKCPFVVRPWGRKWKIVGDAYAYGLMEGEAWDLTKCKEMDFV